MGSLLRPSDLVTEPPASEEAAYNSAPIIATAVARVFRPGDFSAGSAAISRRFHSIGVNLRTQRFQAIAQADQRRHHAEHRRPAQ